MRFATLAEAKKAIALCSDTYVRDTRIVVGPAKESQELFTSKPAIDVALLRGGKSEGRVCHWSQSRNVCHWSQSGNEDVGGGGSTRKYGGNGKSTSQEEMCIPPAHSASTVDDVITQSHDTCRGSDDQSDSDSDSWDEELLTSPFSIDITRKQIHIPRRAVSVPVQQHYAGLSPRNTPNDQGLTLVHVSVVRNKVEHLQIYRTNTCTL